MAKKPAILVLELAFLLVTALASPEEASRGGGSLGACRQSYGFLPCTRSAAGNGFLIFVYGYLVYKSGKWLIVGGDVLLEINGFGVFGGLFLPLLCSLPGAFVILACGLFGSKETAQSQASIGMGLLAGSTISLLTVLWGSCVIAGNCDLHHSTSTESPNTKASTLTGYGVVTDRITSHSGWIMVVSIVPFVLVLLLQILLPSRSHLSILISLIVSVSFLLCYSLYQIFEPWVQHRRLAYAKYKHVKSVMMWLTETGDPDREAIIKLFKSIDHNSDGYLSATELKALIFGLNFEEIGSNIDDTAQNLMNYFDTSGDSRVDEEEFVQGISKYIMSVLHSDPSSHEPAGGSHGDQDRDGRREHSSQAATLMKRIFLQILFVSRLFHDDASRRREDPTARFKYSLLPKENKMQLLFDGKVEGNEDSRSHGFMAMVRLVLGALIAAAFAGPLVEAVNNFSIATTIPPFLVSFVILPFICSTEIFPSLALAARKKQRLASLIFSEIYRNVTMSNILNLSTFLIIVYVRNLTWNFSPETIVVVFVCVAMGAFAGFRTIFPLWTCLIAYSSYPLSLAFVYVLHFVLGRS